MEEINDTFDSLLQKINLQMTQCRKSDLSKEDQTTLTKILKKSANLKHRIQCFVNAQATIQKVSIESTTYDSPFDKALAKTMRPLYLQSGDRWNKRAQVEKFEFQIGFDARTIAECVFEGKNYDTIATIIGEFARTTLQIQITKSHTIYKDGNRKQVVYHIKYSIHGNEKDKEKRTPEAILKQKQEALRIFPILGRVRNLAVIVKQYANVFPSYEDTRDDLVGKTWPVELSFSERLQAFDGKLDKMVAYLLNMKASDLVIPTTWNAQTAEKISDELKSAPAEKEGEIIAKWKNLMEEQFTGDKYWERIKQVHIHVAGKSWAAWHAILDAIEPTVKVDGKWDIKLLKTKLLADLLTKREEREKANGKRIFNEKIFNNKKRKAESHGKKRKKQKVTCSICGVADTEKHQMSRNHFKLLCFPSGGNTQTLDKCFRKKLFGKVAQ